MTGATRKSDGKPTRSLTNDELRAVWNQTTTVMSAAKVRALRLTILLGRRISVIAGAQRSDARLNQQPPALIIPAGRARGQVDRQATGARLRAGRMARRCQLQ